MPWGDFCLRLSSVYCLCFYFSGVFLGRYCFRHTYIVFVWLFGFLDFLGPLIL